jgi:hypothetical protein
MRSAVWALRSYSLRSRYAGTVLSRLGRRTVERSVTVPQPQTATFYIPTHAKSERSELLPKAWRGGGLQPEGARCFQCLAMTPIFCCIRVSLRVTPRLPARASHACESKQGISVGIVSRRVFRIGPDGDPLFFIDRVLTSTTQLCSWVSFIFYR